MHSHQNPYIILMEIRETLMGSMRRHPRQTLHNLVFGVMMDDIRGN